MASKEFMRALQFAAEKHTKQRRKDPDSTPYVNHVINVSAILAVEANVIDEGVLIAALLHDVIEDTNATFDEVYKLFGADVVSLVREVTDDKTLAKDERKRLQIENAANCTPRAKLIKLADKLDNLRDLQKNVPNGWTEERREQYFVWAKKVVDNMRGTNEILERRLDEIFSKRTSCN